jgi:hypothetical protein
MGLIVAALGLLLTPVLGPAACLGLQVVVGAAVYLRMLKVAAPGALVEVINLLTRRGAARV